MVESFAMRGWTQFAHDPAVEEWAARALVPARRAVADPDMARWRQCGGTWFVGLEALENDAEGRVGGSGPLPGAAAAFIRSVYGEMPELHRAQVSVVYPGYPRPREGEGAGAFRYRQRRDAAHVDGILAVGRERRRMVREPHAWILGLPLTETSADAAPLVVWEGSHVILQAALALALAGCEPGQEGQVDVTEAYTTARRRVFASCRRVELAVRPGEAVLLHRLALHGIAPWGAQATAGPDGRMMAYFRPPMPGGVASWLTVSERVRDGVGFG